MVDLGETNEAISHGEVKVGDAEIVLMSAVEARANDIGGQSAENAVQANDLVLFHVLVDARAGLGDTVMDGWLQGRNGTLGKIWVEVAATGSVLVVLNSPGCGVGNIKGTNSGWIFVCLSAASRIDGLVKLRVANVYLASVDANNGALTKSQLSTSLTVDGRNGRYYQRNYCRSYQTFCAFSPAPRDIDHLG